MAGTVAYLSLLVAKDILQLNLWWRTNNQGLYFGITMSRALTLYKKGLRYFRYIRDPERCDFWNEKLPKLNSPLKRFTKTFDLKLVAIYGPFRAKMLSQQNVQLTSYE